MQQVSTFKIGKGSYCCTSMLPQKFSEQIWWDSWFPSFRLVDTFVFLGLIVTMKLYLFFIRQHYTTLTSYFLPPLHLHLHLHKISFLVIMPFNKLFPYQQFWKLSVIKKQTLLLLLLLFFINLIRIIVIFRLLYFCLTNRRHPERWVTVVPWLNYLILAVDLWRSSTQHQVTRTADPTLDSSALLHIHYGASHGFYTGWRR